MRLMPLESFEICSFKMLSNVSLRFGMVRVGLNEYCSRWVYFNFVFDLKELRASSSVRVSNQLVKTFTCDHSALKG
jgi:hypothetical protein